APGRPGQLPTTQVAFTLPERFELEYVGEDGQAHRPVMIPRAIYGTYERFIAILIEHYGGAFPLWLAPIQAGVIPIPDRHLPYAESVGARLRGGGFPIEVDGRRERIPVKIHQAQGQENPHTLVGGGAE